MSLKPSDARAELADRFDSRSPRRRLGPLGFIIPVAIVTAAGIAGLVYYARAVERTEAIAEDIAKARNATKRFDFAALQEAEAAAKRVLQLDPEHPAGLSYLALAQYGLTEHGLDRLNDAQANHAAAALANVETPVRYAVGGYLGILDGRAEAVDRTLTTLLESGAGAPIVAHALGWAKADQGAYLDALQMWRRAIERDFSAVGYRLTVAEYAHRNGDLKRALRTLEAAYGNRGNPQFLLAKAWAAALYPQAFGTVDVSKKLIAEVRARLAEASPRTKGLLAWAEAEHAFAAGDTATGQRHLDEAKTVLGRSPVLIDLQARAATAKGQKDEAAKLYAQAASMTPKYRNIQWALARARSDLGDDGALAVVDTLEKRRLAPAQNSKCFEPNMH